MLNVEYLIAIEIQYGKIRIKIRVNIDCVI